MTLDELNDKFPAEDFPGDYNIEDIIKIDPTPGKLYTFKLAEFFINDNPDYQELEDYADEYRLLSYHKRIQRDINQYDNYSDFVEDILSVRNSKALDFTIPYDDDTIILADDEDKFIVKLRSVDEANFYCKIFNIGSNFKYRHNGSDWESDCITNGSTWFVIIDLKKPYHDDLKYLLYIIEDYKSVMYDSDNTQVSSFLYDRIFNNMGIEDYESFFEKIEIDDIDPDLFETEEIIERAGFKRDDYEINGNYVNFKKSLDLRDLIYSSGYALMKTDYEFAYNNIPFYIGVVDGNFEYDANNEYQGLIYMEDEGGLIPNKVTGNFNLYSNSYIGVPSEVGGDCESYVDECEYNELINYIPNICGGSVTINTTHVYGLEDVLDLSNFERIEGNLIIYIDDDKFDNYRIGGVANLADRLGGDLIIAGKKIPKNVSNTSVGSGNKIDVKGDYEVDDVDEFLYDIGYVKGSAIINIPISSFEDLPRFIAKDLIIKKSDAKDFENLPYVEGSVNIQNFSQKEYDKIKDELYRKNVKYNLDIGDANKKNQVPMFESNKLKYIKPFVF